MNPENNSNLNPIPAQPQQLNNGYQQPIVQPPKKNNKLIIIIIILVVVGIIGAVLYFANQDKEESTNNKTNTAEKEKNNNKVDNENSIDKNNKPSNGSSNNDEKDKNTTHDKNSNDKNNKPNSSSSTNNNEETTTTPYDETGDFLFSIDDVFTITDKGTYVNGKVERGTVKIGDVVQIIGLNEEILTTEVISIERFRKQQSEAKYGETVSIWLKDIEKEQVQRGQVLAKPNSIKTATKFEADIHILSKEEGGTDKTLSNENNPQFHIGTADVTGKIKLPNNKEKVNPGEDASIIVELEMNVAMEKGTKFSIRENGKEIGTGVVTKVY